MLMKKCGLSILLLNFFFGLHRVGKGITPVSFLLLVMSPQENFLPYPVWTQSAGKSLQWAVGQHIFQLNGEGLGSQIPNTQPTGRLQLLALCMLTDSQHAAHGSLAAAGFVYAAHYYLDWLHNLLGTYSTYCIQ